MEEDVDDEDEEEDEAEDEDGDEDNSKEARMFGQGEMVNTLTNDSDSMVDNHPTMLPDQAHDMCEDTPSPHPPAPATGPPAPEPRT